MNIRVGAADEREICVAIWLAALRARDGRDPGLDVAARAHAKFEQTTVRFAIAGTKATGFALTVDTGRTSESGSARLELLAVDPDHLGRGIGRALLDDAVEAASRRGYSVLELHVRSGNTAAQKLYSSAGFSAYGNPTPHPLGGEPMVGYTLRLAK